MFRGLYVRDRQERETDRRIEGKRERQNARRRERERDKDRQTY